jgi:hypothetical protein
MARALAALGIAVPVTLVLSCAQPPRSIFPQPVERVQITISDCTGNAPSLAVYPWSAGVSQRIPRLEWRMQGAESFSIVPKDPNNWPFPPPAPQNGTPQTPVGITIPPGLNTGAVYQYRILLRCGARVYDIDPDIIITD